MLGRLLLDDSPLPEETGAPGGALPHEDPPSPPVPPLWAARLHVGLYAFRPRTLERFVSLPPSQLEQLESLEQMRALEAGMTIAVGEVAHAARGVDTRADLQQLDREMAAGLLRR